MKAAERMVALLAEGVDRNLAPDSESTAGSEVALLAEGVDRNDIVTSGQLTPDGRPPRRGRG